MPRALMYGDPWCTRTRAPACYCKRVLYPNDQEISVTSCRCFVSLREMSDAESALREWFPLTFTYGSQCSVRPFVCPFLWMKPAVDKSVQRVQTKLASMLNRLELEIQSVEKRIGDKMHVLDRDKVCGITLLPCRFYKPVWRNELLGPGYALCVSCCSAVQKRVFSSASF